MVATSKTPRPRFATHLVMLTCLFLWACGGGGSGSGSSVGTTSISGRVVKGPVINATVRLFSVEANGKVLELESVNTGINGEFSFHVIPQEGSVVLLEASGGSYVDEFSQKTTLLTKPLRAVAVRSSGQQRLLITSYSEVSVKIMERKSKNAWMPENVIHANQFVGSSIGVTSILDFSYVDLTKLQAWDKVPENDLIMSLFIGGQSGMANELSKRPPESKIGDEEDSLYQLIVDDPFDDRVFPPYLLGLVGYVDRTALPPQAKEVFRLGLLTQNLGTGEPLEVALPTGLPSGGATKSMTNDAFEFVTEPNFVISSATGTVFNSRGALVAYDLGASVGGKYNALYSASVGEVFGDGEVGIGRWHGGVNLWANRIGLDFGNYSQATVMYNGRGMVYAVGKSPTNLASCGLRTLNLASQTKLVRPSSGFLTGTTATELTHDSVLAVQYLGSTVLVSYDIGVKFSDTTIVRYKSTAPLNLPWAGGSSTDSKGLFSLNSFDGSPTNFVANGMIAGEGGRKVVLSGRGQDLVSQYTVAAVFIAPETPPDISGCATDGGRLGTNIDPAPADGEYYVFGKVESDFLNWGFPLATTFGLRGELLTTAPHPISVSPTAKTYELSGNQYASIGRIKGPFTLRGVAFDHSFPYAVAKPATNVPTTGTKQYGLLNATSLVPIRKVGSDFVDLQSGSVNSASLSINFGEQPLGTPNQFYGDARLKISFNIGGTTYSTDQPSTTGGAIGGILYQQGVFSSSFSTGSVIGGAEGALSGPNLENAVIHLTLNIGNTPVYGALLLKSN